MTSYSDEVLQPGETVRYEGTLHWIIFLPGVPIFAVVIGCWFGIIRTGHTIHGTSIYPLLALIALSALLLHLAAAWILQRTTEIAVTNRRVIYKTGLFSRRTVEMNMDKVESVDVTQDFLGRLLDYGTVLVRGTGTGLEPLANVASPVALRNAITVQ
ncbi:MAG TPA: PH domain-containing protein [Rhizomicrobium sp.]|jgi:uncharacterized membrane protein YdbT with pleckstrin-like domain